MEPTQAQVPPVTPAQNPQAETQIDPILGKPLPYFCKRLQDKRLAFFIDHHLIDGFNTCERQFYFRHLMHLRPKGVAKAMSIGIWWSRCLELFYQHMMNSQAQASAAGTSATCPTAMDMLAYAVKAWEDSRMDELSQTDPDAFTKFGGQQGAILMASQYYDRQALIDFNGWKVIAAERGFGLRGELVLYEDSQIIIYYVGKPDLTVLSIADDQLMPVDHKSVDRIDWQIQRKYKPHPQTAGYIWAIGELARQLGFKRTVDRCVINVAARSEPSDKPKKDGKKKPRFTRVYPNYAPEEIAEWRSNIVEKVRRLLYCITNDIWLWKESSCHLYSGCSYRGIDSLPPNARQFAIASDFTQVAPWTPYDINENEE